jgi:hypothetical protein
MHPTQIYVQAIMDPYHLPLRQLYDRAWDRYEEYPADARATLARTSKGVAVNIWALATDEAIKHFFKVGIVPRLRHGTFEFPIHQNIVARFKLTDSRGTTSNYRTKRAIAYDHGLPLPDVPELLRVTVGWVPNENGTGIADVLIALQGPVKWCYSISANASGGVDLFQYEQDDPDSTGPIIRPREDDDHHREADYEAAGGA